MSLGLRLGLSSVEVDAIGKKFADYNNGYKALEIMKKCEIQDSDAAFRKVRSILRDLKQKSATIPGEAVELRVLSGILLFSQMLLSLSSVPFGCA